MRHAAWSNVQCASVWNELEYKLYRVGHDAKHAALVFSGSHQYTIDRGTDVTLSSDDLLIELEGLGLEGGFRRTYVLHYSNWF